MGKSNAVKVASQGAASERKPAKATKESIIPAPTGGVKKDATKAKKKSSEIDDIFSLASTSEEPAAGAAPLSEELKAVAEQIKRARAQKAEAVRIRKLCLM